MILIGVFTGIFYTLLSQPSAATSQTEVVFVLPVKNRILSNDHNWVPVGEMDQLINLLMPNKSVQVMTTEYVLQMMDYAALPRDYDSQKVSRIFEISGATLIVESELSGSVDDYQLAYKLRYKNDIKRGVIFDNDLTQAVNKLAQVIVNQTGQKPLSADNNAQTTFANELMARAQEKLEQQQLEPAQSLLLSLKELEPHNLTAREKLIDVMLRSGKFEQAMPEIDAALNLAQTDGITNIPKIYVMLATLLLKREQMIEARSALGKAEQAAILSNNVLLLSEIYNMRGKIELLGGAYDLAQNAYEQSLKFTQVIRCPIGTSVNHLHLARVFSHQGKHDLAIEHYNEAKQLIETHQFNDMLAVLAEVKLAIQ